MKEPCPCVTNKQDSLKVELEIKKLLDFKAIEECSFSNHQYLSSFFIVPKPDGSQRFILNLKGLNEFIRDQHFKMEDLRTALNLLSKGDYMCRLDLKDAYFLIFIDPRSQKYLRFKHKKRIYQFRVLPFGLKSAPYLFTKIIKVVVTWLRERGVKIVYYLDDFLIMAHSITECERFVKMTISILEYLGFLINWRKCIVKPTRFCKFLGININTTNMTLELPQEKRNKIKQLVDRILKQRIIKVKILAKCIGTLIAACPAVAYGWLYCKHLEQIKTEALIFHRGDITN